MTIWRTDSTEVQNCTGADHMKRSKLAALQRECVIQAQSGFLPLIKQWVLILTAHGAWGRRTAASSTLSLSPGMHKALIQPQTVACTSFSIRVSCCMQGSLPVLISAMCILHLRGVKIGPTWSSCSFLEASRPVTTVSIGQGDTVIPQGPPQCPHQSGNEKVIWHWILASFKRLAFFQLAELP